MLTLLFWLHKIQSKEKCICVFDAKLPMQEAFFVLACSNKSQPCLKYEPGFFQIINYGYHLLASVGRK